MRNIIIRVWKGEAPIIGRFLYAPLGILSCIYTICLSVRQQMYRLGMIKVDEAPIPVISVGNITLGGTGKTPVVERLSTWLKEIGYKPAIVTRGYRRQRKGVFSVDAKRDDAASAGDEAFMLARKAQVPVIVGTNRAAAILEGIREFGIDVVLLDDGFQVKNLKKDVEVLILKEKGMGRNDAVFPLGPNREPVTRIQEADVLLVHDGDHDGKPNRFAAGIPMFRIGYKPAYLYNLKRDLIGHFSFLRGKRVLAFSGLGDNESFFGLLADAGARVVRTIAYPDHHKYTPRDMEKIAAIRGVDIIVTTEKDAVKLSGMNIPARLFYLAIDVHIEREQELFGMILGKLQAAFGFQQPAAARMRQ
jgi:tetraacyldisaccharide 4'-kinase